jgi:hypothetical protein
MASTKVLPAPMPDLIQTRWEMATRDVQRFAGEHPWSTVMGKRWLRVDDALGQLGARLVDDINEDETEKLDHVIEGIWESIQYALCSWAEAVELDRIGHRTEQAS